MLVVRVALLFTGAACFAPGFAPGRVFSRGGESLPPARPASFVMTITVPPDDDGVFGMTSFKDLVSQSVYVAMLEQAAAAQAKVAAAQAKVAAAQEKAAAAQEQAAAAAVESANTKVDLAQQEARADKLQNDWMNSNTQRLSVIGHIDLRAILSDVLPRSKTVESIEGFLGKEQNFVKLCRAEDNISADNNGKKVTENDIATRLAALWSRSCSKIHPAVTSTSWSEVNVGRVLPLENWLDDKTDLLLMYLLLKEKQYPVTPPALISPTPAPSPVTP